MLARNTKVIEPEEQEAAPSKANRKEAEHENIYQSMKKIGPPFHIYPCLPNALYPEANVYDTLPIHSGGVVGTQGEDVDEENIYVLAGSPISHLKKYQTLHRADLGSMTGKAEVSLLGRKPRRSNSLTLLTLILVLLVNYISAIPQVQDVRDSDTSKSQGKEIIHVQNGTSASILCRSFAQYGGVVTWSVKEGVLPENFQENKGYLIIDSVEKDLDLSCQVVAGFSTFQDDFKIIVTPALSLEESPLPQYLEGFNCASSFTKPIVRSAAYTADCRVDDFAAYTAQPERKFLLLGRERVVKAEAKRCFITVEVSRAICERKIVSGFTKIYQGLYDTSLSQCKELHDTGKTNLLVHRQAYLRDSRPSGLPDSFDEPDQIIEAIDLPNITTGTAYTPWGTPSRFDEPVIGPLKVGEFFTKSSFLAGSGVNKSDSTTPCWGTKRSHYVGPGRGFRGYDHTIGMDDFVSWSNGFGTRDGTTPVVVSLFLTAMLDLEPAFINYEEKVVRFPRMGQVSSFEIAGDIVSF